MIRALGTNQVLACQMEWKGLSMDSDRWKQEAMEYHFGQDLQTRKEMKNPLDSISSVSFVFVAGFVLQQNGDWLATKAVLTFPVWT